jgi:hypothetical protein
VAENPQGRDGTGKPATRPPLQNTCGGCRARWAGDRPCHCSACHRTFAGVNLFDMHRTAKGERGECLPPATIRNRAEQPLMFFRNGMWRGPEMTDEQKAAAFGRGDAA